MKIYVLGLRVVRALSIGAIVTAALASCGPLPAVESSVDRADALAAAVDINGGSNTDSAWNCPTEDNVTLKSNVNGDSFDYSGSQSFKVCGSTSNGAAGATSSTFKITGQTSWRYMCVLPGAYGYSQSAGTPVFTVDYTQTRCYAVTSKAIEVTFNSPDVNYMVIVDYNYYQAMLNCLSGSSACPTHSEGFVQ
jgi:hypothetical protein